MRQTVNANKPQKVDEVKGEIKMNTNINMSNVPAMTIHEAFTLNFIDQKQLTMYIEKKIEKVVVIPKGMIINVFANWGSMDIRGTFFASRKVVCDPSEFTHQVLWLKPMPDVNKGTEQLYADAPEIPMSPYFVIYYHPMFLSYDDDYYYSMPRQIKSEFDREAMYVGRYRWDEEKCGWFRDYNATLMEETRELNTMVDFYEYLLERHMTMFDEDYQLSPVYEIQSPGVPAVHHHIPFEEKLKEIMTDAFMEYDYQGYTPTDKEMEEMKERATQLANDKDFEFDPNDFECCSWVAYGHPHGFDPSNE